MHPETLFSASGKLAMAGWALLVFAPRWRWSQRIASVDHSPHTRDCLPRSNCSSLCKIPRWLWLTRTGRAAFSESMALACRMDTLLGFRLISGRVAVTAGSAPWDFPLFSYSMFAAHISSWPHRSPCILGHPFCGKATIVPGYGSRVPPGI